MAILSAKYGLVDSESLIKDYNEVMDLERAKVLLPRVIEYLKKYDVIVYFKAGARSEYTELIEKASIYANCSLISFGSGIMAGVNKIPEAIRAIKNDPRCEQKNESGKKLIENILLKKTNPYLRRTRWEKTILNSYLWRF